MGRVPAARMRMSSNCVAMAKDTLSEPQRLVDQTWIEKAWMDARHDHHSSNSSNSAKTTPTALHFGICLYMDVCINESGNV